MLKTSKEEEDQQDTDSDIRSGLRHLNLACPAGIEPATLSLEG